MRWIAIPLVALLVTGCGYNRIQQLDEQASAYKSQIEVQLQRRADLVPNLVETVKGYAKHEDTVFSRVAEARSKLAGAVQSGSLPQMAEANQNLTGALGRLIAISEAYPQLKANENFKMLQDQLEGTENRYRDGASGLQCRGPGLQRLYPPIPAGTHGQGDRERTEGLFRGNRSRKTRSTTGEVPVAGRGGHA